MPRIDLPAKTTGQFQYIQHVRLPGMLHGKVIRPPVVGATVVNVDRSSGVSIRPAGRITANVLTRHGQFGWHDLPVAR